MTLPTDIDLVDLAAALYDPKPGDFDKIVQVADGAPFIAIKHGDGFDIAIARGSQTAEDWLRDFESELGVAVRGYEVLGMLPHGFARHMSDTYQAVVSELQPGVPLYGSGHSLGAPEVLYLCAAHLLAKGLVQHIALFEAPKPGTPALSNFYALGSITSYWNDEDPVPDAPAPVPLLLPWQALRPARRFNLGPEPDPLHPLARHDIALCQQGVRQLQGTP